MSQENVEIVRAAFEALNRGDIDAMLAVAAPDFEVDMSRAVGLERGVYTADQSRALVQGFIDTWESAHWDVTEYIDAGEHVVTPITNRLKGREGIEVEARVTWVWTLRTDAVERIALYQERAEALEAVGLQE